MLTRSLLRNISIGIIVKDILEDDLYIDIAPIEIQTGIDGELSVTNNLEHTVISPDGTIANIKVTRSDIIKAKWMPYGDTNRLEPPTVCKGERVRIYQYSDTDQYYWTTLYNELELRKVEKRTIVVSNKASIEIPADELLDHTYYAIMDTINKLVKLRTSTTDGEYTTYDITIDTREGQLEIIDGKGNQIHLDSQTDILTTSINKQIINNTIDKTENISHKHTVNLVKYAVNHHNGDELLQIIYDLVTDNINDLGVGNLGADVPRKQSTIDSYKQIQTRLAAYMGQ